MGGEDEGAFQWLALNYLLNGLDDGNEKISKESGDGNSSGISRELRLQRLIWAADPFNSRMPWTRKSQRRRQKDTRNLYRFQAKNRSKYT